MELEKYGNQYSGKSTKRYSYKQAVNRLQQITHFFLDILDAGKYIGLAENYNKLSIADKKRFDAIIDSVSDWLTEMEPFERSVIPSGEESRIIEFGKMEEL